MTQIVVPGQQVPKPIRHAEDPPNLRRAPLSVGEPAEVKGLEKRTLFFGEAQSLFERYLAAWVMVEQDARHHSFSSNIQEATTRLEQLDYLIERIRELTQRKYTLIEATVGHNHALIDDPGLFRNAEEMRRNLEETILSAINEMESRLK